jgi:hypothetical protein
MYSTCERGDRLDARIGAITIVVRVIREHNQDEEIAPRPDRCFAQGPRQRSNTHGSGCPVA